MNTTHQGKARKVKPTQTIAKTAPTPKLGPFATLRAFLHVKGTGAPKTSLVSRVWEGGPLFMVAQSKEGAVGTRVSIVPRGGSTGSSAARAPVSFPVRLLLVTVLALLVCFTGSSLAETGHGFTDVSFGGEGSGAGKLREPAGVAVNDTTTGANAGDVYVADKGNNRIDEFDSAGTFIRAWGWGVATGASALQVCTSSCLTGLPGPGAGQLDGPEAIAVDNSPSVGDLSKGDVYVTTVDAVVEKFSATGAYEGQLTDSETCETEGEIPPCAGSKIVPVPFEVLHGVAVDPSGNLWVSWKNSNGSVAEFSDTGGFTKSFETQRGFEPGLAVDSSEDVYQVNVEETVSEFDPTTGEQIAELGEKGVSGLTVDPAGNDVYVDERGKIAQYGTSQELIQEFGSGQLTDGGGSGVAIDSSNGTVYVADSTSDDVIVFAEGEKPEAPLTGEPEAVEATRETLKGELNPKGATGTLEYRFDYNAGGSCVGGQSIPVPAGKVAEADHAAVQATALHLEPESGYTYCLVATGTYGETRGNEVSFGTPESTPPKTPEVLEPEPVTARTATLKGVVNPNTSEANFGSYEFRYRKSATECQGGEPGPEEEKATPSTATHGVEKEAASFKVEHLLPHTTYTFCLLARNEAKQSRLSSPETFTTLAAPPMIASESVSVVEATAATLEAEIVPEGAETTYRFQYGTSAAYGQETQPTKLKASDDSEHLASARIPEAGQPALDPDTIYYYRVIAENGVAGKIEIGKGKTFTTNSGTEPPQNCPNEKLRVEQPFGQTLPDCRAYEMVSPVETGGNDATDAFIEAGHVRASEDRAKEANGEEATPAITYISRGSFAEPDGRTFESQLLSRREPENDRWGTRSITPPFEHDQDGEELVGYTGVFFTPELTEGLATTAADLSSEAPEGLHELYRANFQEDLDLHQSISYQLVSQLPRSEEKYEQPYVTGGGVFPLGASSDLSHVAFITENQGTESGPLREWVDGQVFSVGVSNEGQVWTGAAVGSTSPETLQGGGENVWRAVSEDGSRVILNYSHELYARVNAEQPQPKSDEQCTVSIDACTVKLSAGAATYWGANTDDSKIFYVENGTLYEYKLPVGAVKGEAKALALGGEVQGVVQVSEDGSYVYFVANGVLGDAAADGATPGNCGVEIVDKTPYATGTSCNLYVSHEGGEPVFIATLSAQDGSDWLEGPGADTAVLAPGELGGVRLAFISQDSLTGYDNRQAAPEDCMAEDAAPFIREGGKCREVYLYDAETGAPPVCVSCNPTGARPIGPASLATGRYGPLGGASNYRPRDLLADGSLFFDSSDALVPPASDGLQNVYEYEGGQIHAISNVSGGQESSFLDASPNGKNVFFASADRLLPEDTGDNVVVWDAREDGGFPVQVSAPACTTAEACRAASPPTPSVFGTPPSATFSGPGNIAPSPPPAVVKPKPKTLTRAQKLAAALKVCKKDKKKSKRQSCEKQARAKYGPVKKKAKKSASNNRRTKS
jgi:hypothetical protein